MQGQSDQAGPPRDEARAMRQQQGTAQNRAMPASITRRAGLALLGAAAWPALHAQAAQLEGEWTDAARSRHLPWLLRLPATSGPWPVVVYSHGLGGSRDGGALWGQAWAEAGIAVLHLQHPGSDSGTLKQGLAALRAAASAPQLLARVGDVRFAFDELARRAAAGAGPWTGLRLDALGVAGHSFGAVTTQAVAGQRFPNGQQVEEPRPRAFIAFSPSPAAGSAARAFAGITRPFMAVTGSLDGDPFGSYRTGEPRAAIHAALPPGQRALLWLDGADHATCGGGAPRAAAAAAWRRRDALTREREPAHQALVARLSSAWWRWRLLGDDAAPQALRSPAGLGTGDRWVLD